jgi:DNA-binding NarL/FixJ family response regulator
MDIRVFNADDHPLLRKGVSDLLRETEGLQWVGSASDGREALEKIRAIQPDVAILDIEMPHLSGLEVAQRLIQEGSKTAFILLTLFKDESFFRNALASGIMGYLLKESSETEIIDAIRSVYRGRPYVNPGLTHLLINPDQKKNQLLAQLSEQEINILKLIAQQKTSSEIANMLFISPKTVANHRSNISKKLDLGGVQNGLLKWALEHKDLLLQ